MSNKKINKLDTLRGLKNSYRSSEEWGKDWIQSVDCLVKIFYVDKKQDYHGKVGLITQLESFCMGEWVHITLPNGEKIEIDYFATREPSRLDTIMYLTKKWIHKKRKPFIRRVQ